MKSISTFFIKGKNSKLNLLTLWKLHKQKKKFRIGRLNKRRKLRLIFFPKMLMDNKKGKTLKMKRSKVMKL
jgi:hypothetical protein